jgi:uncharacterized protein YggE
MPRMFLWHAQRGKRFFSIKRIEAGHPSLDETRKIGNASLMKGAKEKLNSLVRPWFRVKVMERQFQEVIVYRILLTVVFLVFSLSAKEKEIAEFIKVEGIGKIVAKPDYAILKIGVYDVRMDADSAQANVSKVCADLFALCARNSIDTSRIKTTKYSINRKTKYNKDREEEFLGYEVVVLYDVKVDRISVIDTLLANAVILGSNEVRGVEFKSTHEDSLRASVQILAMQEAMKNAENILKPTGHRLGRLIKTTDDYRGKFDISSDLSVELEAPQFVSGGALSGNAVNKKPVFIRVIPDDIEMTEKIHAIVEIK